MLAQCDQSVDAMSSKLIGMQILNVMGVPYETVNILEDDSLRFGMKEYSPGQDQ